jgi:CRP-like cAMP-binding protein
MDSVERGTKLKLTDKARQKQSYKKKFILYQEDHRPLFLYFIISGKIKSYKTNEDGKELIIKIHTAGDFIGYTPILEDTLYKDNAEILEESELMLIPREDFLQLISFDNQLAKQFIKLLTKNVVENEERLINLAYNSVRKRVAIGLLEVQQKYKVSPESNPSLDISREDLAQVVGTATESLIRTLSEFKADKYIDIKDGKIRILQEAKLKNLMG